MNSRVHPKCKTRYRVTNWADYDQALVQGGNITLWITPVAIKGWTAKPTGHRGAPQKYSDLAIETALTLQLLFHLPLRQAEGFLRSLLELIDLTLEAPDHTTLSRKNSTLAVGLGVLRTKKPIHLIIDSTDLSIVGEGEWAAAKHGGRGRRGWRKLHLGADQSGVIQAQILTDSAGYHRQGTVENAFFRYKSMLGARLHARGLAAQKTETIIACKVLNQMLELGRPRSVSVAR